jgi:glutamate racemase
MDNNQPIGIFDSGIGGTSIWKRFTIFPNEKTIYLADSKNAYMAKNLRDCSLKHQNTDLLLEMNCKLIVVACNTATTNAIRELRAKYDIPLLV